MDLGDFLIPLLIIGSVIVQWLGSGKKPPPEDVIEEAEPFDGAQGRDLDGTRRVSRESPPPGGWDDLMEALGQSGPATPPPLDSFGGPATRGRATPPPLVETKPHTVFRSEPVRDPFAEQKRRLEESQRRVRELESKANLVGQAPAVSPVAVLDVSPSRRSLRYNLRSRLNDRRTIREAILLNEILQPPVALR